MGYKSEKLYCLCDERWGFGVLKYIEFSFDVRRSRGELERVIFLFLIDLNNLLDRFIVVSFFFWFGFCIKL